VFGGSTRGKRSFSMSARSRDIEKTFRQPVADVQRSRVGMALGAILPALSQPSVTGKCVGMHIQIMRWSPLQGEERSSNPEEEAHDSADRRRRAQRCWHRPKAATVPVKLKDAKLDTISTGCEA